MTPEELAAKDAAFIRNEDEWPNWPILPVKRLGHYHERDGLGIVVAPGLTRVYLVRMHELKAGLIGEQLVGVERLEFESVEAMVAAGWVAD